jgi:hypothetical protein
MTDIRRQRPEVLRFKKRARELAQESNEMEDLYPPWAECPKAKGQGHE